MSEWDRTPPSTQVWYWYKENNRYYPVATFFERSKYATWWQEPISTPKDTKP